MKNNKKAGISLVALVVTIIVLIILTAAVILTFMEGGIVDRAKEAVFKSDIRTYQEILAVKNAEKQIEIATGNGEGEELNAETLAEIQEIIPEFKEEYDGLIAIINGEIVLGGVEKDPYTEWLVDLEIGLSNEVEGETTIVHSGVIPEGGTYYVGVGETDIGDYTNATIYEVGAEFPELQTGDIYVYGDYEYRYNMEYSYLEYIWYENTSLDGWGVRVLNNSKSEYSEVLNNINSKDVVSMDLSFAGCYNLIEAPEIPDTIIDMSFTFQECSSLKTAPTIKNGVSNMEGTFYYCSNLENITVIPDSVTNMCMTFEGCTLLNLSSTFVIPSNVTNLAGTFRDCTSLSGTIDILASNITNYYQCFSGTEGNIFLMGNDDYWEVLAATSSNGNVTFDEDAMTH